VTPQLKHVKGVTGLASLNTLLGVWGGRELRLTTLEEQAKKTSGNPHAVILEARDGTVKTSPVLFASSASAIKNKTALY
jgi:hypothetical protein